MVTPFSNFKTTELSAQEINQYFVKPQNYRLVLTKQVAFVEGQRGSGKTMLMRYIAGNTHYNEKGEIEYLGVYLRFDRFVFGVDSLSESDLFFQHVIISLISALTERLKNVSRCEPITSFQAYADEVHKTFYDEAAPYTEDFDSLLCYIEKQRVALTKYLRNPRRVVCPLICDYSTCLGRLVRALHKTPMYSKTTILILFDEYENLNDKQQEAVNGMIKSAEAGYTYKVFHRPFGIASALVLGSREYLKERDDYSVMDFYQDIIGGSEYFAKFAEKVISKRLSMYYVMHGIDFKEADLNIDKYLDSMSMRQEVQELVTCEYIQKVKEQIYKSIYATSEAEELCMLKNFVDDLSDNPIRLRLYSALIHKSCNSRATLTPKEIAEHFINQTHKYKNWEHNYSVAVLYLMYHERNRKRCISGMPQILAVSDGIIRYVLNILHYTFFTAEECGVYPSFSVAAQSEAVRKVAKIAFDDMINIPNVGREVTEFIRYIGETFAWYHQDPQLKKWEVNHFTITEAMRPEDEAYRRIQEVITTALTWGMLNAREATKLKTKTEFALQNVEYGLHPIFTVYFNLSWRRKQKCDFKLKELYSILYGDSLERKKYRKERYDKAFNTIEDSSPKNGGLVQISLFMEDDAP